MPDMERKNVRWLEMDAGRRFRAARALAASGIVSSSCPERNLMEYPAFFWTPPGEEGFSGTSLSNAVFFEERDGNLLQDTAAALEEARRCDAVRTSAEEPNLPLAWFVLGIDELLSTAGNGKTVLENSVDKCCEHLEKAGLPPLERTSGDGGVSLMSYTYRPRGENEYLRKYAWLRFTDAKSNKFYKLLGPSKASPYTTAEWGRIGTVGQTGQFSPGDFQKKLTEKTKKGYCVVDNTHRVDAHIEKFPLFSAVKYLAVLSLEASLSGREVPPVVELHANALLDFFDSLKNRQPEPEKNGLFFSLTTNGNERPFRRVSTTLHRAAARIFVRAMEREETSTEERFGILGASGRFLEALENTGSLYDHARTDVSEECGSQSFEERVAMFAGRCASETEAQDEWEVPAL